MILRSFPVLCRRGATVLTLALSGLAGGCSSSPAASSAGGAGAPEAGADGGGTVGCSGQGDTYTANLVKPGSLGVYTFTLAQASPAPPALNGNTWTLKIADKSGAAPSLAQVVVYPFMPLMGHGSDQTPTITANADGTFSATDVNLFMPGLWTVTTSVTATGDAGPTPATLDKAVYTFCIE
jgi:hypothetical protein